VYDYLAKVSIGGKKAKPSAAVAALSGTMSDIPAISPVPITGPMDVALNVTLRWQGHHPQGLDRAGRRRQGDDPDARRSRTR